VVRREDARVVTPSATPRCRAYLSQVDNQLEGFEGIRGIRRIRDSRIRD
jgi:hypothetical protein